MTSATAQPDPDRGPSELGDVPSSRYRVAAFVVLSAAVVNSVGGVVVRSIEEASGLQIVFFRGAALFLSLSLIFLVMHREKTVAMLRRSGRWSLLGGVFLGGASTCLVISMTTTTIANTAFVLSSIPFLTAILAWVILREPVLARTLLAMLLAMLGIGFMVWDGIAFGTLYGNAMALAAAFLFSCFVVVLRRGRANDMLPATMVGSLISAALAAVLTAGELHIGRLDFALIVSWGVLSSAIHALFVFGSRHVRGAELTLLIQIEFVLAPFWVWLLFNEVPSGLTLTGGALVLGAVVGWTLVSLRDRGQRREA